MTGSVYPCDNCNEQNWVTFINDEGLCKKCANTNKLRITVDECYKCKEPQVFKNSPGTIDSDIPVALELSLDGGYMMFVDNIYYIGDENPFQFMLCHSCAHEFTKWLGIPEKTVSMWHPKTDEEYCNGWKA